MTPPDHTQFKILHLGRWVRLQNFGARVAASSTDATVDNDRSRFFAERLDITDNSPLDH